MLRITALTAAIVALAATAAPAIGQQAGPPPAGTTAQVTPEAICALSLIYICPGTTPLPEPALDQPPLAPDDTAPVDTNCAPTLTSDCPAPVPALPGANPFGLSVRSITVVDADKDRPLTVGAELTTGASLDLSMLPTAHLNLSAVTSPATVGSVAFDYDGRRVRVQNYAPYTLAGDMYGDYYPWTPTAGTHTVTATPFTGPGLTGVRGTPLTVTFTVVGSASGPLGEPGGPGDTSGTPDPGGIPAPGGTPAPGDTPAPGGTPAPSGPSLPLGRLLAADMTLPSEAVPHGITYEFAYHPRLGGSPGSFKAFMAWGQLYECRSGNPQAGARVEIRDIEGWIKSKTTGAWTRVQESVGTGGSAFIEDFVNNVTKAPDAVVTSAGSMSVRAGSGFNYHFWPTSGRASINPGDVAGVITTVRARLLPGTFSSSGPPPCYVLSVGADYWSSLTAGWSQFTTNKDVGIGRFKLVDPNWRLYTMSTTSAGNLPAATTGSAAEVR